MSAKTEMHDLVALRRVTAGCQRRGAALAATGGHPFPDGTAAAAGQQARVPLRELMDDRLLDALLERSRDEAGGLRLTAHVGYEPNDRAGHGSGNSRNGRIAKTVQTGVGPVPLQVPWDRAGTFEPVLIPKRAGRVAGGLDDMIISLYAHGIAS